MSKNTKLHLPELDLLRGFAALFMVAIHAYINLLGSVITLENVVVNTLVMITSFAPVLFFFSSGVGSGIQSVTKNSQLQLKSTLYKFTLLMVADAFFAWGTGKLWGFDFLGFIAVIVILLELVRCFKFAKSLCVIGVILIFVSRFFIGPRLDTDSILLSWLTGYARIEGSSYAFSPWFSYPLIGFLLGALIAKHKIILVIKMRNNTVLLVIAALFSAFSYYLSMHDYSFFRWGTMSFGYYCLSFVVIPLIIVLVSNIHHLPIQKHLKLLYLSGTASLAIVPIHYYLIYLAEGLMPTLSNTYAITLLFVLTLLASFVFAKSLDKAMKKVQSYANNQYTIPLMWVSIITLGLLTYGLSTDMPNIAKLTQALGQLTICILFSLRVAKKPNIA